MTFARCNYICIANADVYWRSAFEVWRGSKAKFSVSTGETWPNANPLSPSK